LSQYCKKLEKEEKLLNECIFIEKFSKNEIKFESELLDMVIQPESVSYDTSFTIKECTNYKLTEKILSPIYEVLPHNISFDKPISIRFKNFNCKENSNIYLMRYQDNSFFSITYISTPIKKLKQNNEEFTFEFELNSFSLLCLGDFRHPFKYTTVDEGIFNNGTDIIRPGLNYGLGCFLNKCVHGVKIINMNFVDTDLSNDYIYCTNCNQKLALKIIFYKTDATITFKKNDSYNNEKIPIKVKGSDIMFIGNKHQMEKYSRVNILVNANTKTNIENIGIRIHPHVFRDLCDIPNHFNLI
jgi:hypothetical protein